MASRTLLLTAFAASACLTPAFAGQRSKDAAPPPGLVLVEGGRTTIGTELKVIEARILEEPEAQQRGNALLAETPDDTIKVDSFFLMVTEVTNEQYETFVRATGHKPPEHWASPEAEKAARDAFAKDEATKRQEAQAGNLPAPERKTFEREQWWTASWRQAAWSVPKDTEHEPVTYVSHGDAKAYARWAGLRLMTEFEYQRAVRGDSKRAFPWGDEFVVENAATLERPERRSQPFPVGSFPSGAANGVFDLAGNVWEWTDSPYTAFKGYKPLSLTIGKGRQKIPHNFESAWDADARVCVSGSVQNGQLAARATARRRLERVQTTDVVGFRCAASLRPGQDIADTILAEDLPGSVRPSDDKGKVQYRTELVLALDRWSVSGTVAKDAASDKQEAAPVQASAPKTGATPADYAGPPAGYAVIDDYEYIVFVPATAARYANQTSLREETVDGQPVALGVLSTTFPVVSPELPAGTYMVGFRGKGERKRVRPPDPAKDPAAPGVDPGQAPVDEEPVEAPWEEGLALDLEVDNFIFFDNQGKPLVAVPCPEPDWSYTRMDPGTIDVVDIEIVEGEGKEKVTRTEKRLKLEVMLESLTSSKGYRFTLPLQFDEDVLALPWRQ